MIVKAFVWLLVISGGNVSQSSSPSGSVAPFMFNSKADCERVADALQRTDGVCVGATVVLDKRGAAK